MKAKLVENYTHLKPKSINDILKELGYNIDATKLFRKTFGNRETVKILQVFKSFTDLNRRPYFEIKVLDGPDKGQIMYYFIPPFIALFNPIDEQNESFTYLKPKTEDEIRKGVLRMDPNDILDYALSNDDELMMKLALKKGVDLEFEEFENIRERSALLEPLIDFIVKTQPLSAFAVKKLRNGRIRISFSGWEEFAGCFRDNNDISQRFIENMLIGEDIDDFYSTEWYERDLVEMMDFIKLIDHNLQRHVKGIKRWMLKQLGSWDSKHEETKALRARIRKSKDFLDLFVVLVEMDKKYDDFDDLALALRRAANETTDVAASTDAYDEIKGAIIDHFSLSKVSNTPDGMVAEMQGSDLLNLTSCLKAGKYDDSDNMINYHPPYYGWSGNMEDHIDVFIDCFDREWE